MCDVRKTGRQRVTPSLATPSRTKADAGTGRLPQGWLLREWDRYLACLARQCLARQSFRVIRHIKMDAPHSGGRPCLTLPSSPPTQLSSPAICLCGMKIDRPGMAIIGAVLMVAFGTLSPSDALHFVDLGTIVLLFSMMLLVAYLHLA